MNTLSYFKIKHFTKNKREQVSLLINLETRQIPSVVLEVPTNTVGQVNEISYVNIRKESCFFADDIVVYLGNPEDLLKITRVRLLFLTV